MEKENDLERPMPCKRCGHTLPNIVEYKNILGDTYYFVECVVCKARTKGYATETMAKQMWQYPQTYIDGYEAARKGDPYDEKQKATWRCGYLDYLKEISIVDHYIR